MSTTVSGGTSSAVNAVPGKVTLGVPTGRIDPGDGTTGRNGKLVGLCLQNSFKRMFQYISAVDLGRITGTIDRRHGIVAILPPGRDLP